MPHAVYLGHSPTTSSAQQAGKKNNRRGDTHSVLWTTQAERVGTEMRREMAQRFPKTLHKHISFPVRAPVPPCLACSHSPMLLLHLISTLSLSLSYSLCFIRCTFYPFFLSILSLILCVLFYAFLSSSASQLGDIAQGMTPGRRARLYPS